MNETHKPNFFVVGVVKGGTTSLYHYLLQHPEIYLPAIKETNPKIRVIGVEPESLPSMTVALREGHPVELAESSTLADGIAVRRVGELTLANVAHYVDDIVTVSEEQIANAILTTEDEAQAKDRSEGPGGHNVGEDAAVVAVEMARLAQRFRPQP